MSHLATLPRELVEKEIVPHLDLPSCFALSLVELTFNKMLQNEDSLLKKALKGCFPNEPIEVLLVEVLQREYYVLFDFLLPIARRPLRSLSNISYSHILYKIVDLNRFDLLMEVMEVVGRRCSNSDLLLLPGARSCASLQSLLDLLRPPSMRSAAIRSLLERAIELNDLDMIRFALDKWNSSEGNRRESSAAASVFAGEAARRGPSSISFSSPPPPPPPPPPPL